MKRMIPVTLLITVLLITVLLITALALPAAMAEDSVQKDLTLMIYMCGSNLESQYGSATDDILEILHSGVDTDQVNIVVMTGGSKHWSTGQDADTQLISVVRGNQPVRLQEEPSRSMGDSETLRNFIDWSVDRFPASEYALILWDHGGGPMEGLCWDEVFDPDQLTVQELVDALRESALNGKKLEWIGFDACLMGSTEVALQLIPYARYMISSEETEPKGGWDYAFLKEFAEDPDGAELGRRIVDTYMDTSAEGPMTLSCVDLEHLESLRDAVDRLFLAWQDKVDVKTYSAIARLRKGIAGYGMDVGRTMRDHDLIDLGHLATTLSEDEAELGKGVMNAISEAVVYNNSNIKDSCGLSVYFPYYNKERYDKIWRDAYADIGLGKSYERFINHFGEILTGEPLADWHQLPLALFVGARKQSVLRISSTTGALTSLDKLDRVNEANLITEEDQRLAEEGILAKVQLDPAQQEAFASARLMVLERFHTMYTQQSRYRVLYTSPALGMNDDGAVRGLYEEQTLQVLDGKGDTLASEISYTTLDNGEYAVEVKGRSDFTGLDGNEISMIMTFRQSDDDDLVRSGIYVYDSLTDSYERRSAFDSERYPYLVFPGRYVTIRQTEEGDIQWQDSESYTRESVVKYTDDLRFAFQTATAMPEMILCMEITDTQNNRHITSLRTVSRGSEAPDLMSDCPFLRILVENMEARADRIDLKLTFIASEDQSLDVYAIDPRMNNDRVGFMGQDGPVDHVMVHVDANSSVTQTLSLTSNGANTLKQLSLRFAIRYSSSLFEDNYRMENGILVINGGDGDQEDSGEEIWEYTERAIMDMKPALTLAQRSQMATALDMDIQAGALYDNPSYQGFVLDSLTPIASALNGKPTLRRISLLPPEEARGFDTALLLGGTPNGNILEVSVFASEAGREGDRVYFVFPCSRCRLVSNETAIPVATACRCEEDIVESYLMTEIQLLSNADEGAHRFGQTCFDDDKLTHVNWVDAKWPVELADSVQVLRLKLDMTVGVPFQFMTESTIAPVRHLPMEMNINDEEPEMMVAIYLDDNKRIMAIQTVDKSDLGHTVFHTEGEQTEVYHYPSDADGYYPEYQTGDWIGWYTGEADTLIIVRYTGDQTDIVVPSNIGQMTAVRIEAGAFDGAPIQNITLPVTLNQISANAFEEHPTTEMLPLRDIMTFQGRMSDFSLSPTEIHEICKFKRAAFEDGESLWQPPLIFGRLATGDWAVTGCNTGFENIRIPSEIDGTSVVSIAPEAFVRNSMYYIKTIDISEGIEEIGAQAFAGSSLTEITLPKSLKKISADAFEQCAMLGKVNILCDPDILPDGIFDSCPLLREDPSGVILPLQASAAQVKRLSEALGMTGNMRLAKAGEEPLSETQVGDISRFMGKWVATQANQMGEQWIIISTDITIYENGVYNGQILSSPIEGRWVAHGNSLQTEDAVMFLHDDANMFYYANQFKILFHKVG